MGRKSKVSAENKILYTQRILEGTVSRREFTDLFLINRTSIDKWITIFKTFGPTGFLKALHINVI